MNHSKYHQKLGTTAACSNIMMESTNGIGHKYKTGATMYCSIFDSWLSSNNSAEASM